MLRRTLGCCRKVYNMALDARSTAWMLRKENVGYADTSRMLTAWKKTEEYSYLSEVSSVPLQQSLRHLQAAFKSFFNKTGSYPRFKAKHEGGSATYTSSAFKWDWERKTLTLAKMSEPLPIRWSRTLPRKSQPSSVTVSLDAAVRWHVSILVEDTIRQPAKNDRMVGVDMGLEYFAILSNGEKIDNPRYLRHYLKKLRLEQQKLDKKKKGSNNYRKARLKVAKAYAKVKDCRTDFLHKLSTRIIRENQTVVIEDLRVRNMSRRCKLKPDPNNPGHYLHNGQKAKSGLTKSILDAGWRQFRTMLEYKADWYGRQLTVIDQWYPSSQICHTCGKNTGRKTLDVRTWECPYCHAVQDRDINAAKNILSVGLAVRACGDSRLTEATLR